jgi:putative RNA 2'-phosphotransferase
MTEPVSVCPDHGYYAEVSCPRCGADGEEVVGGRDRRRLSKFLSGVLRHFPDVGVRLDAAGWAAWDAVVGAVETRYDWADERTVEAVVATDPKGRFERRRLDRDEATDQIRAAYGHSLEVDLDADAEDDGPASTGVPDTLYHGTAPDRLDSILDEGLRPMGRQLVHLSGTRGTAETVGRRHTDDEPVVLAVDVRGLERVDFAVRERGPETYTVERVPPAFVTLDRSG